MWTRERRNDDAEDHYVEMEQVIILTLYKSGIKSSVFVILLVILLTLILVREFA